MSNPQSPARSVVVFGRQPEPGRVKTRLGKDVGPEAAARVYEAVLEHVLHVVGAANLRFVLSLAEDRVPGWLPPVPVEVELQPGGDLGSRIRAAFERRFVEGDTEVAVIGSDCPEMTVDHLVDAFNHLQTAPVVLGPAVDGGYWLVAQRAPGHQIFTDIPWSSALTLAATRRRLGEIGVAWQEIAALRDLDTVEDLRWFAAHHRRLGEVGCSLRSLCRDL